MNYDYAHCWDYERGVCPEECFGAKLTDDLKNWPHPVTYSKFKGTEACPFTNPQPKPTNADRIRAMTDEQLAAYLGHASLCVTIQGEDGGAWCSQYGICNECIRDWLRQEATP